MAARFSHFHRAWPGGSSTRTSPTAVTAAAMAGGERVVRRRDETAGWPRPGVGGLQRADQQFRGDHRQPERHDLDESAPHGEQQGCRDPQWPVAPHAARQRERLGNHVVGRFCAATAAVRTASSTRCTARAVTGTASSTPMITAPPRSAPETINALRLFTITKLCRSPGPAEVGPGQHSQQRDGGGVPGHVPAAKRLGAPDVHVGQQGRRAATHDDALDDLGQQDVAIRRAACPLPVANASQRRQRLPPPAR